jgi:DNA replication protein DnaC
MSQSPVSRSTAGPERHLGEQQSLTVAAIRSYCRQLRMPTIAAQCVPLSQDALRENTSHLAFLEALLREEVEERTGHAIANRVREARLPRFKTLEEFDFNAAPHLPAPRIRALADGAYLSRGEPILLIGDCGTGKNPPGNRALCGRVPTAQTCPVHDRCRPGQ